MENINLNGKYTDMQKKEKEIDRDPFLQELQDICCDKGITTLCMYNSDKMVVFYQEFLNALHVENNLKNDFKGKRIMQYNSRQTARIITAFDGERLPI